MRRKDREITDLQEIVAVIRRCDVCRLAIHDEDYPYIVPMNFGLDVQDGQVFLYFHCAMQGKKLDLLARDSRVSFEMDCGHELVLDEERMSCTMNYASVIGRGVVTRVPEEEKYGALKLLMRQYHAGDFPFNTDMMKATTVLKLTVEQMTGKRRSSAR